METDDSLKGAADRISISPEHSTFFLFLLFVTETHPSSKRTERPYAVCSDDFRITSRSLRAFSVQKETKPTGKSYKFTSSSANSDQSS